MPLASPFFVPRGRRSSPVRFRRRALGAALAAVFVVGVSACSADPVAEQYRNGDGKGYISADLAWTEIAPDERTAPVEFSGVTEHGEELTSADTVGTVTVVNFWYAACGPCRVEAKDLQAVWDEYKADEVSFVGVNTYDQADTAAAFAEQYGITYPSIIDVDTGSAKLAFAKATPIQATPTTLVLDREGRVAARIIGQLDGPSILSTLVRDTLAEKP